MSSILKQLEKVGEKVLEVQKDEKKQDVISLKNQIADNIWEGLITKVVEQCKCERVDAVKALQKHKNDVIQSILELTKC